MRGRAGECCAGDEIKFAHAGIFFTWDDEKAIANWKKHKVDFLTATEVFFDDCAIDVWDLWHNEKEDRRSIIGRLTNEDIVFVVYVERIRDDYKEVIRIISARSANRKERKQYERGLSR